MPHFFMRSTGGVAVVVVADSATSAEALAAVAGLPRVGRPAYRANPDDLRAHAGAFRLVGAPTAWPVPAVTLEPGQGLPPSPANPAAPSLAADRAARAWTPSTGIIPVDQQRSA